MVPRRKYGHNTIRYNSVDVDGFGVAYREAGPASGPALLLMLALEVVPLPVTDIDRALTLSTDQAGFARCGLVQNLYW